MTIDDEKEQTHDMANRFRNRASLFVLATWTLGNHVAPDQEVLKVTMMIMMIMMMTGMYLIALIGKNLPVWFSSEVMVKKGLLQIMRWSLLKILFFLYSSSHFSSSFPSSH